MCRVRVRTVTTTNLHTHTHTYYLGVRTVRVHQLGTNKHNKPSSLVSMYRHQTGAQNTELYPSNRYNNMMYCTYVGTSVRRVYTHTYMSTCCSQVLVSNVGWDCSSSFRCVCAGQRLVCVCVCVCMCVGAGWGHDQESSHF